MKQNSGRPASSSSRELSRSLLGSDAFVEIGRARRVPPKKRGRKEGPLLNCTAESRRRAQAEVSDVDYASSSTEVFYTEATRPPWWWFAGLVMVLAAQIGEFFPDRKVLVGAWTLLAASLAVLGRPQTRTIKRKKPLARPSSRQQLASCWASSERAPPLPLLKLPPSVSDVEEAWFAEAGIAPRWTKGERRYLARVRATFSAELANVPPYLDAYGDRRMLRFLRMDPQLDEEKAIAKVSTYLAWRRESKADEMRKVVDEKGHDPSRWPHGHVLLECIRLLQCSEEYFDKKGNAVTVYQAFHWPAKALRARVGQLTTKELVEFATFGAEYNAVQMERISVSRERVLIDHARKLFEDGKDPKRVDPDASATQYTPLYREGWGELTRLCAITDMTGCTFSSIMMPALIPTVVQSVSIFVNHYPFIVGELHVINCNALVAKVFKKALQAVVPKHIADQVQIHVNADELFDSVRHDNLPVQVGGSAPCDRLVPPPPPPLDLNELKSRPISATEKQETAHDGAARDHASNDTSVEGKLSRRGQSVPVGLDKEPYDGSDDNEATTFQREPSSVPQTP